MNLEVRTQGDILQVVVTAMPRAFVRKIFQHCWGKNNTPYFANNCFKGVLYFDERLAQKYAEDVGFAWTSWLAQPRFHHMVGAAFSLGLEIEASLDGARTRLGVGGLRQKTESPAREPILSRLGPDEVAVVLGAVDKGQMIFSDRAFSGPLVADRLSVTVTSFGDLYCEEAILSGLFVDGKPLSMEMGESRGKNMLDPVLIGPDGKLLDMYDFS